MASNRGAKAIFLRGAAAMAAALAAIYLGGKLFPPLAFPPVRLGDVIRDNTPGGLATWAIETAVALARRTGLGFLQHAALQALSITALLLFLTAGGVGALLFGRIEGDRQKAIAAIAATAVLSAVFVLAGVSSPVNFTASAGSIYIAGAALYSKLAAAVRFSRLLHAEQTQQDLSIQEFGPSRRRFIIQGVAVTAGLLLAAPLLRRITDSTKELTVRIARAVRPFRRPAADPAFPSVAGLTSEITSNEDFYVIDINIAKPVIDHETWKLKIAGQVDRPFTLSYAQLQNNFEVVEMASTLTCISNEVGGELVSTAVWRGVRLKDVLAKAGLKASASELIFRGAEGYSDSIPAAKALEDTTLVVFGMNGKPLPVDHGFPARIVVPGIFGMKNVKWLTAIEATDRNYRGYWQKRGWSDAAPVKTQARIDVAGADDYIVAGVAWAGDRGISRVEVSDDEGSTWKPAVLNRELAPNAWRQWALEVPAGRKGRKVLVRAADGTGALQTGKRTRLHPSGASGYDSALLG